MRPRFVATTPIKGRVMAGVITMPTEHDHVTLDDPGRELMLVNHQIKNHHSAPVARTTCPKTRRQFQVTVSTDGTWFTIHGVKKDEAGFDLHFSTDGGNAEVSVNNEPDTLFPALRLFLDRPV
jgi:hypothetical protein